VVIAAPASQRARPRLRGVFHLYAFFASLVTGVLLIVFSPGLSGRLLAAIYAASVTGLFGVSALYHRVSWSEVARRRMRRLDHSMIFLLIAGTYTPVAVLALSGPIAAALLIAVWAGALGGIVMKVVWLDAPKAVVAAVYVALGWLAIIAVPQVASSAGVAALTLVVCGGVLYTLGAIVYAARRPDPAPTVFGYHEIFHVLVIAAAALHYVAVAFFVLPRA
jgi:hemolysin III